MVMDFTIWQETYGNGAAIYIIFNHTVLQPKKESLLTPKVLPVHWIQMNRICPSVSYGADLIYAMIAIAVGIVFPNGCVPARIQDLVIPAFDV
tara:strand:- start:1020 stop:1298 length:279 start_codon:yes stop_codon:yes gene_type:complete